MSRLLSQSTNYVPRETEEPDVERTIPRGQRKPETSLLEDVAAAGLSKVYERHGRIDLEPMPSDDSADPLNWSSWRKNTMLGLVAWHTLMGPFSAAAVIPAFMVFSAEFGISITQASYFVSGELFLVAVVIAY